MDLQSFFTTVIFNSTNKCLSQWEVNRYVFINYWESTNVCVNSNESVIHACTHRFYQAPITTDSIIPNSVFGTTSLFLDLT